jgi:hypothetical protein
VDLTYTAPQPRTWEAYGTIDIALDPFPHNAGTTTIEALWQGVPVVTLAGRPSVGRFGAAILHAAGLDDWVTETQDAYVARAVAAATDLDALAALRSGLRPRLAASALLDADGLALVGGMARRRDGAGEDRGRRRGGGRTRIANAGRDPAIKPRPIGPPAGCASRSCLRRCAGRARP